MAKRRRKPNSGPRHETDSGYYSRQIITCLRRVNAVSGHRPDIIFDQWTRIVEASLEALPTHLKSVARTGRLAEDPPETAQVFARIRADYTPSTFKGAWESFGRAFALLLESSAPGLWAFDYDSGYMGPDILGHVFMEYTRPALHHGQYMTPWNIARLMSECLHPHGPDEVYARLKQACQHPDNALAQATLLAGLVIEDPDEARRWFINRVVPAAIAHYSPIAVCDPCVGSGVMLLAMAASYEPWMVQMGLVQFYGQDVDPLLARLARTNCLLYGLNGYTLALAEAVGEALKAWEQSPAVALPRSPQAALERAAWAYRQEEQPDPPPASPTFEEMFKTPAP